MDGRAGSYKRIGSSDSISLQRTPSGNVPRGSSDGQEDDSFLGDFEDPEDDMGDGAVPAGEPTGGRSGPRRPGLAAWFGGPDVIIGPRICPIMSHMKEEPDAGGNQDEDGDRTDDADSTEAIISRRVAEEASNDIRYRTCSWQKTAALLFSEYICLAIMSFPWSYSVLGLIPGVFLTIVLAFFVQYTSLILWQFCLRHPEVRDISDIGQMLFWGKSWAWYATTVMFILNNTFIQGLHILVGAQYLNTMLGSSTGLACQTVTFSILVTVLTWLCSLPRTFDLLSIAGTGSAAFTFISVVLATAFAVAQGHPAGYDEDALRARHDASASGLPKTGEPIVTLWPLQGAGFVALMNAFLNMSYTFIGQITLPSFIAEMEDPRDFPKALWACTILEVFVFTIVGAVIYAFTGSQYVTSPAFGSLTDGFKKISFSFMIPTIIFVGVLYASVSGRFVFLRVFRNSRHMGAHTVLGWAGWASILFMLWTASFLVSQLIPFFVSLLSIMGSLFDCFFGFLFWGVAFFRMRQADKKKGTLHEGSTSDRLSVALNVLILLISVFFLLVGTWASIQSVYDEFSSGDGAKSAFSCESNAL